MRISKVGRIKLAGYAFIMLLNLVVFILTAKINSFMDFFYAADVIPFCLSIITFITILGATILDFAKPSLRTGRPAIELSWLGALMLLWLVSNSFSSDRWKGVSNDCTSIPSGFEDERNWCKQLSVLRAFVWIQWVAVMASFGLLFHFVVSRDEPHVWDGSLLRYDPNSNRKSEFLQEERAWSIRESKAPGPTWQMFN